MGKIDLTGQKFGRLTVVEEAGRDKRRHVLWRCRCECGQEVIASSDHLRSGHTISCGCFRSERTAERHTKHGLHKHPLYRVWRCVIVRCGVCKGADDRMRKNYIERGITVCEEWKVFQNFHDWAISHGYKKGLQIDRIDNDRGYCPDNCHFVTPKQNNNNRRNTLRLSNGEALASFAERFGVQTMSNNKRTKSYTRIEQVFRKCGSDVAIAQVWGEAVALRFAEYGMKLVPFSKLSILA